MPIYDIQDEPIDNNTADNTKAALQALGNFFTARKQAQMDAFNQNIRKQGMAMMASGNIPEGFEGDYDTATGGFKYKFKGQDQKSILEQKKLQQEIDDANAARQMLGIGQPQSGQVVGKTQQNSNPVSAPISKTIKYGGQEFVNPAYAKFELEQKAKEDAQKPLSAEGAVKLGGAKQSLNQIDVIRDLVNSKNFKDMRAGYTKIRTGQDLGITKPGSIFGTAVNALTGGISKIPFKTTDDQKKFELALNLVAENNVRAKSGAAVPDPEQVREELRQLSNDDSFTSFLNRVLVSEDYAKNLAEDIRPGSSKDRSPATKPKYEILSVE